MKRISYIIAALLMLSSCEDFLSFDPLTQKTDEIFPQTAEDAKQMITGIYTTMSNEQQLCDMSYHFVMEVASDEKLGGGGNNDYKAQAYEGFMYSEPNMLSHNWETTYEGIHRANFAIEKLPGMNPDILPNSRNEQYQAEALFLRAFFYYRLVTLYGSVPLKITSEPVNMGGAPVDDIYAQIASDLKQAIELFPDVEYTSVEDGRANRWAAQAMMARVWLFYTGFYQKNDLPLAGGGTVSKQDVVDGLKECVEKSGHYLVDDFHELWPYTNSVTIGDYDYIQNYMAETGKDLTYASDKGARNPETLFALKFSNFADWDIRRGYANMYQLFFALRGLQNNANTWPFAGGWGQGNSIPKQIVDQWLEDEPNDPRLGASVLDIEAELYWEETLFNKEKQEYETIIRKYSTGQWDFVWESNYWGKKYNGVTAREDDGEGSYKYYNDYSVLMYSNQDNQQLSHGDDLIFIRYADVLLMLSELTEDAQYMNEVRDRADLPPVGYTIENLRKERQHELAFEGLRYNDMRRWGADYAKAALESQIGAPVLNRNVAAEFEGVPPGYRVRYDETKGFYPIPQIQIDLSDGLLEQVEGYRDGKGLYQNLF